MTSFTRSALTDFDFGIPVYAGAMVNAWNVDSFGNKTAFLATLYADLTSSAVLSNPQTLDGFGKWSQPVYINAPVILTVTGANGVPDHQTGVISANLAGSSATDAAVSAASAAGYFGSVADTFARIRSIYTKIKTQLLPVSLVALSMLRVKSDGSAYELRTMAQVRSDLSLTGTQAQVDAFTASIMPTADQLSDRLQHGRCRLKFTDATHVTLFPFNGNKVFIPSSGLATIPAAGIACAVGTALVEGGNPAANTTYYAYLSAAAGGTLQLSATAHATDAATGAEIRNGDNTRILVGMVRVNNATQFADAGAQRFTLSYFNRRRIGGANFFAANRTTASATYVELSNTERIEFLTWGDEAVELSVSGAVINASAGSDTQNTSIGIDGTAPEDVNSNGQVVTGSWTSTIALWLARTGLAEGYHYATILGHTTAQSMSWVGGATAARTTINGAVRG